MQREFCIAMREVLTYEEHVIADNLEEALEQFMLQLEEGECIPSEAELEQIHVECLETEGAKL